MVSYIFNVCNDLRALRYDVGANMTREELIDLAGKQYLILDGATGSNLQKAGMPTGICPEKWILEHEDALISLQKSYLQAGTNILYAPTFTSNRIKLAEYGLQSQIGMINEKLVKLSREAIRQAKEEGLIAKDAHAYVAGDLTMTGKQLEPMGTMTFDELLDIYREQIRYLVQADVDMLIVETMMSLQETRAAVIAAKEVCDLAVMATITFETDNRTLYGTDPETAAVVLQSLGVAALGANCSTGPKQMSEVLERMAKVSTVPLIAKPNAGLPKLDQDGNTCYDMSAEEFGKEMLHTIGAGAVILGGCCGTSDAYIRKVTEEAGALKPVVRPKSRMRYLTSERRTLAFSLDDPFMIVGERINPTGKKKLQEALRKQDFSLVTEFAVQQEELGAVILDVNMGMSGIDEKQTMEKALEEIANVTNLPLSLDSSHVDVLEAALKKYPGRALVNSVSLEKAKFEKLLPMVKKYGAMFILLPLSDEGLPKNLEEKKKIIHTIMDRALELGMTKEDIVVDGLVATVGANKNAALETLETIAYCKSLGLATICGLSNISFGLPERIYVNTAFLTMAIASGLTMAIANPSQQLLVNAAYAADLLQNKQDSDIRYIDLMNEQRQRGETLAYVARQDTSSGAGKKNEFADKASLAPSSRQASDDDEVKKLTQAVLRGRKNDIVEITKQVLANGIQPKEILDDILLPAIQEVGDLFDQGKYFLPQLIASAEAMKNSIEYLEPMLLLDHAGEKMPTVVIATVEGDIHDIGKNLVALMLKNYGFQVIDLGKDVKREDIIQAAKEHNASVIALSALMTTTMQQMKRVIELKKQEKLDAKVIIGGAVITQEYADEIGADGYSKDAQEAVKLTQRLLHIT